jgi:hypothetical protein
LAPPNRRAGHGGGDGRGLAPGPRFGGGIVDVDELAAQAAEEIALGAWTNAGGFVASLGLTDGFEGLAGGGGRVDVHGFDGGDRGAEQGGNEKIFLLSAMGEERR